VSELPACTDPDRVGDEGRRRATCANTECSRNSLIVKCIGLILSGKVTILSGKITVVPKRPGAVVTGLRVFACVCMCVLCVRVYMCVCVLIPPRCSVFHISWI